MGILMVKKYIVKLTLQERQTLQATIDSNNTPKTIRKRCNILLLADTSTDKPLTQTQITTRTNTSDVTIYHTIKNYCQKGLTHTLRRRKHQTPPRKPIVTGKDEAHIIALACSQPPPGYARWTLRLLTKHIVEQEIIPTIGRETVRKILKKQNCNLTSKNAGASPKNVLWSVL